MLKKLLLPLVAVLFLSGCAEEILYFNVDNQQLKTMLDEGVTIIDIRRPEEWKQTGVVKGSQRLTSFDKGGRLVPNFLPTVTQNIPKDQPVILICRTGNRTSALSAHLSRELGYTNIYNVKDGITRWIREGNPVTRI